MDQILQRVIAPWTRVTNIRHRQISRAGTSESRETVSQISRVGTPESQETVSQISRVGTSDSREMVSQITRVGTSESDISDLPCWPNGVGRPRL